MVKKFITVVAMFILITLLLSGLSAQRAEASPGWWLQTTQADFDAGTQNNVEVIDIGGGDGDVKLATFSNTVTDTFDDETKIASKSDIVVTGGQVKLTSAGGTETLRPDAAGDEENINGVTGDGSGTHYTVVDEATPDGDTTYVEDNHPGYRKDLYNITDHSVGSGTINYITVYARCKATGAPTQASLKIAIKAGQGTGAPDTDSESGPITVTTSYASYSEQWNTNPKTSAAWTWDEIDALQIGVKVRRAANGVYTRCTQVYVVVNYDAYNSPGELVSTNLLAETVESIDSFGYNASAIPSGTGLKVQFSRNGSTWYKSDGTSGGWDDLTVGTHSIDLSALGWSGANFYYKIEFTSDGTDTLVLDEISVTYSSYTVGGEVYPINKAGVSSMARLSFNLDFSYWWRYLSDKKMPSPLGSW